MPTQSSTSASAGNGCLSAITFVAFVALVPWAFFDYTPKEAIILGFEIWAGAVCVLLALAAAFFALAAALR